MPICRPAINRVKGLRMLMFDCKLQWLELKQRGSLLKDKKQLLSGELTSYRERMETSLITFGVLDVSTSGGLILATYFRKASHIWMYDSVL